MRSHYLFESFFCLPGKKGSHEKGGVENLVGYARRNYLVPMPEVESLEELNEIIKERCLTERKAQLWEKEKNYLLELPKYPFECFRVEIVKVNTLQMIQFENNCYSVPREYVGQRVIIKAFVDKIEIVFGENIIARHKRLYQRKTESLNVEHYLDLLSQRPGAVVNARVFRNMDEVYQRFRKLCLEQKPVATKEFVKVLKLHEKFLPETVKMALEEAMEAKIARADVVYHICQRLTQPPVSKALNYPLNCSVTIKAVDLTIFNQLLGDRK